MSNIDDIAAPKRRDIGGNVRSDNLVEIKSPRQFREFVEAMRVINKTTLKKEGNRVELRASGTGRMIALNDGGKMYAAQEDFRFLQNFKHTHSKEIES